MSAWGTFCVKCGHPATYHGATFCQVDAGAERKRQCDCDGYDCGRSVGRCGDRAPFVGGSPLWCSLLAGHDGAHHDDSSGADWFRQPAHPQEATDVR